MKQLLPLLAALLLVVILIGGGILFLFHREATLSSSTQSAPTPTITQQPIPARPEFARTINPDNSTRIYQTLLPNAPGDEWSEPSVSSTKKGERPYLGDFHPGDPITLTLPNLPDHKLLQISFDLFLFRSWDGSSPYYGYAKWDLTADDANLIHTTFNNCGFFQGGNDKQAFPDSFPSRWHKAWTLASEHETLGMPQSWGSFNADVSSVLHLDLTFPHSAPSVVFEFLSDMAGHDKRKLYGIANLTVSTLPDLKQLTPGEIAALWIDLGNSDPQKFWSAQWQLAAAGDAATNFIADHLQDNIDMTPAAAEKLFPALRDNYLYGTEPFDRLAMQGRTLSGAIDKALAAGTSYPDQLNELKDLAHRFPATATELHNARAKHLLQIIHTPAALTLAETIPDQPIGPEK